MDWTALGLSLRLGVLTVLLLLPVGIFVGRRLAYGGFPGRGLAEALVALPLVLPPVVTGLVLLDLFGPRGTAGGFLAEFGIVLGFRWTGAALVAGLVAIFALAEGPASSPAVELSGEAGEAEPAAVSDRPDEAQSRATKRPKAKKSARRKSGRKR